MNVSMLMGALRRTAEQSPAQILESLNRVLAGSESFTTCQAAWFAANGELVLANAGHLPPYLNSQEIVLPGGLPLGVLPDSLIDGVRLYLHPGDRICCCPTAWSRRGSPSGETLRIRPRAQPQQSIGVLYCGCGQGLWPGRRHHGADGAAAGAERAGGARGCRGGKLEHGYGGFDFLRYHPCMVAERWPTLRYRQPMKKTLSVCPEAAARDGRRHSLHRCYSFSIAPRWGHAHDESENVSYGRGCCFGSSLRHAISIR